MTCDNELAGTPSQMSTPKVVGQPSISVSPKLGRTVAVAVRHYFPEGGIGRQTLQLYGYQLFSLALGVVGSIIIAAKLGPEQKGVIDLFLVFTSLLTEIGLLGFPFGILYYLTFHKRPLAEVHGTSAAVSFLLGCLIFGIGLAGFWVWKLWLPGLPFWALLLGLGLAPFNFYLQCWNSILLGLGRAVEGQQLGALLGLVSLGAALAVLSLGWLSSESMILLNAAATIVSLVGAFWILHRREPNLQISWDLAGGSMRYGLLLYVTMLSNFVHFKIDQFLVNYWLGSKELGLYALAVRWAELLFMLDGAIVSASLGRLATAGVSERRPLAIRVSLVQAVLTGMAGLAMVFLTGPIILRLYGAEFAGAIWPLILLVPGVSAWSLQKTWGVLLVYNFGQARFVMAASLIGSVVNIALNCFVLGGTSFGLLGVALVSSLSYCAVAGSIVLRVWFVMTHPPGGTPKPSSSLSIQSPE